MPVVKKSVCGLQFTFKGEEFLSLLSVLLINKSLADAAEDFPRGTLTPPNPTLMEVIRLPFIRLV